MTYYKIIKDGIVIDANYVFLRWQAKHRTMLACKPEHGQFIQSTDQQEIWTVDWLNPIPDELAGAYDVIEAVEITADEYAALRKQLDNGLTVELPEESVDQQDIQPAEDVGNDHTETVMTPEQMRRTMIELQQQNEMLLGCVLELSEIVYAG